MNMHQADKPVILWPCYEPAGCTVSLTMEDLLQHLLIIGSTGSGKTTLILGAIQQLLQQPCGLLILDAKQDGFRERITDMANRLGRGSDLAILGPDGTHALDLFGALRTYDDVETLAQWLMLGMDRLGGDNAYWQNTTTAMINAALTLLVSRGGPVEFDEAVEFMRSWFVGLESSTALSKPVTALVEKAKHKAAKPGACPQLRGALDHVEVWKRLDPRTRSNLQSCLLNVLRPLMSSAATRSFDANDRPAFNPAKAATEGKVACIVSVNALTHPELAKFILRLARRQFLDAVQSRGAGKHPLCGLVADEFPLIVQPEDTDQLATLRSKNCFVLAAATGIAGIEDKVGPRLCRSVLLNFNTVVWMRTREMEAGQLAAISFGKREIRLFSKPRDDSEDGALATMSRNLSPKIVQIVQVCPPGALGRLQPHQGFVMKPDGSRTIRPVWFAPWFESPAPPSPAPPPARKHDVGFNANHVEQLMARAGMKPALSPAMLKAALDLETGSHRDVLLRARDFFRTKACMVPEGLETLPTGWLAGLPGILWARRKPHWTKLPYMIQRVACVNGVLLLGFAQEEVSQSRHLTSWDRVRFAANRCVYPNRWRPLLNRHRHQLWITHPELWSQHQADAPDMV